MTNRGLSSENSGILSSLMKKKVSFLIFGFLHTAISYTLTLENDDKCISDGQEANFKQFFFL